MSTPCPPAPSPRTGGGTGPGLATHSVPPPLQKWCYPAHAWASDPGLLQVLLALTQEYAALGTTTPPISGIGSEGEHGSPFWKLLPTQPGPTLMPLCIHRLSQRTEIGHTSTTGSEQLPQQHLPPRRYHLGRAPARAGDHPSRPPVTTTLLSSFFSDFSASFPSFSSFSIPGSAGSDPGLRVPPVP